MSPKKITDTDKLEIVLLYRQAGETTASLAIRYGVSNSTISRLLKTTIPEHEYEELIQQKRGLKVGIEDDVAIKIIEQSAPIVKVEPVEPQVSVEILAENVEQSIEQEEVISIVVEEEGGSRRVRRRSSAPVDNFSPPVIAKIDPPAQIENFDEAIPETDLSPVADVAASNPDRTLTPLPVLRTPVRRDPKPSIDEYAVELVNIIPVEEIINEENDEEDDDDENIEDVSALAAMFGEEIADGDEEEFGEEEEDDDDELPDREIDPDRLLTPDRLHIQVTPLSQATLPRTCYIVIDKFAELIVRPLKDFAELGQIPGDEIQQRTLPIFDNHRVAKRFSNQRTQRVIKVPDSKVFHKTTHHLRAKGIARLLVDGKIYSLN